MWLALTGPRPILLPALVAHVTGMLAGYGIVVLLALMSRAPLLERGVGSDVLARWHAFGGRAVVGLIVVHAWAAVAAWAHARGLATGRATIEVLGFPGLIATALGTFLFLAVGVASARAARRRLSYERWHALHLWTYVAVAMTFLHQLAGPDLAGRRPLQIGWALLYTGVGSMVLRHRILAPWRQASRHRLRVSRVVDHGRGTVSIEVEGDHLDDLRAESGQFFRWRFLTPDHWSNAHPFSLSAPPSNGRLRLTVKALGDGTARLQGVDVGTWVLAEGPYGAMTAARRTRPDVLLVAGGVGITPMRALFETMPIPAGGSLTLLYRASDPAEVLFGAELDELAHRRGATVWYLLGPDRSLLGPDAVGRLVPDLADHDVYLCGPPGMTEAFRATVETLGLPPEQLHEERFGW